MKHFVTFEWKTMSNFQNDPQKVLARNTGITPPQLSYYKVPMPDGHFPICSNHHSDMFFQRSRTTDPGPMCERRTMESTKQDGSPVHFERILMMFTM